MAALCQVLSTPDDNLWKFELADGRGMKKAAAYLYPFLADKSKWPLKPDVQAWAGWPAQAAGPALRGPGLRRAAILGTVEKASSGPGRCRSPPQHGNHAADFMACGRIQMT